MFSYPVAWTRWTWLTLLLMPLSWLFRAVVALRRALYRAGVLRSERLPVPVIVVGNISVGGTGKTPLVLWLAAKLREHGYQPGIISRGYGGSNQTPRAVQADSDAGVCGDEPVLLARRSHCPVWICRDRAATARALLAANPACNVIISDDGLQHYRLARDAEIAVVDGARGLGNGLLLPAGPLREPPSRLNGVDAVVARTAADGPESQTASLPNGTPSPALGRERAGERVGNPRSPTPQPSPRKWGEGAQLWREQAPATSTPSLKPRFCMTMEPIGLRNLSNNRQVEAYHFKNLRVHAVAGIGNPQQFFDTLTSMGITHTPHAFADHHAFAPADLTYTDCDAVVMTEKDAVKCEAFASEKHWALQVNARVDDSLLQLLLERIKRKH